MSDPEHTVQDVYDSPLDALIRLLNQFWLEHDHQAALVEWREYAERVPEQAALLVRHVETLVAHPPPDLPEIVRSNGDVYLYDEHGEDAGVDAYHGWLNGLAADLRHMDTGVVDPEGPENGAAPLA